MTTSTWGRSSPRAATSVQRSIDGEEGVQISDEKAFSVRDRAEGDRCPCRECRLAP